MANEGIEVYERNIAIDYTFNDDTAVEKGTLMILKDEMSVSKHSGIDQRFAGIAAEEKTANSGTNAIGIKDDGVWKLTLSGVCGIGNLLALADAANQVYAPAAGGAQVSKENFVGNSLANATDGQSILVKINPIMISNIRSSA